MSTLLREDLHMVLDRLFIGCQEASEDPKRLKLLQVSHIIYAVIGQSPLFPSDFEYMSCDIPDDAKALILPRLPAVISFI